VAFTGLNYTVFALIWQAFFLPKAPKTHSREKAQKTQKEKPKNAQ
jgi:hypothetical protein